MDKKLKYEKPELISIANILTQAAGCAPGSGDTSSCTDGSNAVGSGCWDGVNASGTCSAVGTGVY